MKLSEFKNTKDKVFKIGHKAEIIAGPFDGTTGKLIKLDRTGLGFAHVETEHFGVIITRIENIKQPQVETPGQKSFRKRFGKRVN